VPTDTKACAQQINPVELAAEIVAAFVCYNPVPKSELPSLIEAVHSAVERLEKGLESAPPQIEAKAPAVPIRKSITPDYLISLEDGKPDKLLRRHLTRLGVTPAHRNPTAQTQQRAPSTRSPAVPRRRWARRTSRRRIHNLDEVRLRAICCGLTRRGLAMSFF
jgi:predicted transcriptional regulator